MRLGNRGITLWELLAVIVILGVLTAVLAPSITGIINNSKKDAHIANAYQVAAAAKLYVVENEFEGSEIPVADLISAGYIDEREFLNSDPDGVYDITASKVEITTEGESLVIKVYLHGEKYDVGTAAAPVDYTTITRDDVAKPVTSG